VAKSSTYVNQLHDAKVQHLSYAVCSAAKRPGPTVLFASLVEGLNYVLLRCAKLAVSIDV